MKPFHGFYRAAALAENTAPDLALFHETAFRRQYNRFLTEMQEVMEAVEAYLENV